VVAVVVIEEIREKSMQWNAKLDGRIAVTTYTYISSQRRQKESHIS